MKKLLLSAFALFVFTFVYAQPDSKEPNQFAFTVPIDSITNKIDYQGVQRVDGVSKDELYIRAREWFAKTFVSAQAVIQMDDKEAGKIIGKGVARSSFVMLLTPVSYTLYYTVSITVKDGRYRYEITDFMAQGDPSKYNYSPVKVPLDAYAIDPKNRSKKGEYKGSFKNQLQYANIQGMALSSSLTQAMSLKGTGSKAKDDF